MRRSKQTKKETRRRPQAARAPMFGCAGRRARLSPDRKQTAAVAVRAAAAAVAAAFAVGTASAAPWRHETTGLELPDRLAECERGDVTDLESRRKGAGFAVNYRAPGLRITIYLYTAGAARIPDDLKANLVRSHLEESAEAVARFGQMNGFTDIKQPPPRTVTWDEEPPEVHSRRIVFAFTQNGVQKISPLHLAVFQGHFLKVRATYDRAGREESEARFEAFLRALARQLRAVRPGHFAE